MISEEKQFRLLELVPTAISVHSSWDCCDYCFGEMCMSSVKLIASVIDIDDYVLRDAIFQGGGPEPKKTSLSHKTMPDKDKISQSIKCAIFLDSILKENEYVPANNYFIQRYCLHGKMPKNDIVEDFRKNEENRFCMDQWYFAMTTIAKEILFALPSHSYSSGKKIQSVQFNLAELLYWLYSAIDDIRRTSQFIAPYVLNPGDDWGHGLESNELKSLYGQLELKPLFKYHHYKYSVDCCFSFLQDSEIKKVSWAIEKDLSCRSYKEELSATWCEISGLYIDYPEKTKPAFLRKGFGCGELEMVGNILPVLYSNEIYLDLAKEVDLLYEYIMDNQIIEYSTIHKLSSIFRKTENVLYETLGSKFQHSGVVTAGEFKRSNPYRDLLKKVQSNSGSSHVSGNLLKIAIQCLLEGETRDADIMSKGRFAMSGVFSVVLKVLSILGYCSKQENGAYILTHEGEKLFALIHSKS
ncbi:MAG: hypothetical protein DRP56_05840 [Planctomycetota bacterium]|nr:MAG: hypothetical protein DRP56_05840 [Planctomycetota bacterium]